MVGKGRARWRARTYPCGLGGCTWVGRGAARVRQGPNPQVVIAEGPPTLLVAHIGPPQCSIRATAILTAAVAQPTRPAYIAR